MTKPWHSDRRPALLNNELKARSAVEGEAMLARIVGDEPDFEGELWVEEIESAESPN
jgi:hypothetical protein